MASIKDEGDGKFVVRWRELGGKSRWQTMPTQALARQLKREVERDLALQRAQAANLGIDVAHLYLVNGTVREVGNAWLAQLDSRGTTYQVRSRLEKHVYPELGERTINTVRPMHVESLQSEWQRKNLAQTYQKTIWANLKAIYTWAVDNDLLEDGRNPFDKLRTPKVADTGVVDAWSNDWVSHVCTGIRKDVSIFPLLGAYCGLRQGEIFGLSPADFVTNAAGRRVVLVRRQIKMVASRLFFAPPKHRTPNDPPREIPVPDIVHDSYLSFLDSFSPMPVTLDYDANDSRPLAPQTVELLITTREGKAYNRNYFNPHIWKPTLRAGGIPTERVNGTHALRHWFACTTLEEGTSLARLSELLGHKDRAFTLKVYGRFQPDKNADSAEAMNRLALKMLRP